MKRLKESELLLPYSHVKNEDKSELMKQVDKILTEAQTKIIALTMAEPRISLHSEDYYYISGIEWKLFKLQTFPERLLYHSHFEEYIEEPPKPGSVYTTFRSLTAKERKQKLK
jgi:hypothetical protein